LTIQSTFHRHQIRWLDGCAIYATLNVVQHRVQRD